MSLPIVLREAAEAAFDWYDRHGAGLGAAFAAAVQRTLDLIATRPLAHRLVLGDVRKAVVRRFPYCVYFRPHPDRVEVIAVFHTSRDPDVWQRRG